MRGGDNLTGKLFSYVDLEARVRRDHPLRAIRTIVNEALAALEREFAGAVQTRLTSLKSDTSLKPLSVASNETDQRHRCFADVDREIDDVVKSLLGRSIQYVVRFESTQSCLVENVVWKLHAIARL